jgi:hypothetical protein
VADKEELEKLQKTLKEIDDKISELSRRLSGMSVDEVQDALGEIHGLKLAFIHALPSVFGIPFRRWYAPLEEMDDYLTIARGKTIKTPGRDWEWEFWRESVERAIEGVEDYKKRLEKTISQRLEKLKQE